MYKNVHICTYGFQNNNTDITDNNNNTESNL